MFIYDLSRWQQWHQCLSRIYQGDNSDINVNLGDNSDINVCLGDNSDINVCLGDNSDIIQLMTFHFGVHRNEKSSIVLLNDTF